MMLRSKFILLLGLQFVGLIWFLKGFFPRKVTLLMPFLHSLIKDGHALPFTAFSHPPTVTLPRLKGITTGGTPSFVDALLNVADDADQTQGLENVDSWIHQFKFSKEERVLHFFGDDTWLKLFPPSKFFEHFEGTSSFFVSDFTEVDLNVTRHLSSEIDDNSWDALILHYLGLDHIGHKGGAKSVYMAPKQAEMDNVLELLYQSRVQNTNDTLLVLLGDHGMNDVGNHGGASAGETSPGLILASPKFTSISDEVNAPLKRNAEYSYYSAVSQIDIVPTLAALLNFPIPKNNLGIVLSQVLKLWADESSQKAVLMENCLQFIALIAEKYDETHATYKSFFDEFQHLKNEESLPLDSYYSFLIRSQRLLVEESTNYGYFDIAYGFGLICVSVIFIWLDIVKHLRGSYGITCLFAGFCILYSLHFHGSSLIEEEHQIWWFLTVTILFVHLYIMKLRSRASFFLALLAVRIIRGWNDSGQKYSSDHTIFRFLASHPDINWLLVLITYVSLTGQTYWYSCWVDSVGYSATPLRCRVIISNFFRLVTISVISTLSFSFKLGQFSIDGSNIPHWLTPFHLFASELFGNYTLIDAKEFQFIYVRVSRMFFAGLTAVFLVQFILVNIRNCRRVGIMNFSNAVTLFLIHQTRIEIIPIFLVFSVLKLAYSNMITQIKASEINTQVVLITLFSLCLQNLSFFSIGNTNLLATVDLSNAYNGISEYNIASVGILTFVSNFAVAIYWSIVATELLANKIITSQASICFKALTSMRASLNLAFYSISALSLIGSCINLRFHLFIWSVFSPKLLFFGAWMVFINFIFENLLLCLF
ncbi:alkaline phosphatase-like protein [Metschnikowia bicuspidata var. bicuspidata NRRL YB-4993]|uniref:GPI ethanolamine phosphate transferase 2 n=1 Tax=Metschnikowia bicuspidata var. bicuspidata NRRL YB-4993 TaxID=869754 RepID=A0A1A0H9J3_9ASCO|nr:alkaline phosphatase-like protein [Metschnikowia bicuspidata var. bicuspidata NRRL YB-4993]OBA20557.1 alkaline phosphatase-like protein [Metschnikowia bicuspidata var. bicuspidata NRRL YB-4993]